MQIDQIAGLLVGLGVGGAVGALAADIAAASRITGLVESFAARFRAYMIGRTDPESLELSDAFEELQRDVTGLLDAVRRAKRALTPRR